MRVSGRTKLVPAVVFNLAFALQPARADLSVDLKFFHDRLAPYGNWIQHHHYGWVWQPAVVDVDWRPYTHGRWVMTEEYGWLWESDFDWGWACFHYGRWAFDDDFGWIWVPGYEWGPAWVAWRAGDGFVGWAPLPPEVAWEPGLGLTLGSFNLDVGILWPSWVFVEERHFLEPRLRDVIVERERGVTLLGRTLNVTNYVTVENHIANRSISAERIEDVARTKVTRYRVNEVARLSSTFERRTGANEINVFRPRVQAASPKITPPTLHDVDRIEAARRAMLEEWHQAERDRMSARHQKELEQAGKNNAELRRQHKAERQALIERQRSEAQVLQHRSSKAGAPHRTHR